MSIPHTTGSSQGNDGLITDRERKLPSPHALNMYSTQQDARNLDATRVSNSQAIVLTTDQTAPKLNSESPAESQANSKREEEEAANDATQQHRHHHHHHHPSHEDPKRLLSSSNKQNDGTVALTSSQKSPSLGIVTLKRTIEELYPRRRHLGTIMYNPTTTWTTLQIEQLHGLKPEDKDWLLKCQKQYNARASRDDTVEEEIYIPMIPPLSEAYVNSFIDVKIPYKFIKLHINALAAGKVQRRRELWGGSADIYTDDSELLSVLTHLGLFENKMDLTNINPLWTPKDVVRPLLVHYDEDGVELLDLSVTLLLLPPLKRYHGFYRNGINSRSWDGDSPHDGLSYGVFSVKWETYQTSADERSLYKWAQKEDILDKEFEQGLLKAGSGWKFDVGYYKQLKAKFANLEQKGKT